MQPVPTHQSTARRHPRGWDRERIAVVAVVVLTALAVLATPARSAANSPEECETGIPHLTDEMLSTFAAGCEPPPFPPSLDPIEDMVGTTLDPDEANDCAEIQISVHGEEPS